MTPIAHAPNAVAGRACVAAGASGFAALAFEILLFRRLDLVMGQSLKASALVLSAYMAGLALGGLLAMTRVRRRPRLGYVVLELLIAFSGLALILGLPHLAYFSAHWPQWQVFVVLFTALLVPTTAMGWVLPLLAELSLAQAPRYTRWFGRLYASNTAGAVLGALLVVPLLRNLGLRETALIAAAGNLLAATVVLGLPAHAAGPLKRIIGARLAPMAWRITVLSAVFGALMLAMEVVWLRAMLLKLRATDWVLASLLVAVISGLSLGALLARRMSAGAWASVAGCGGLLSYIGWHDWPLPSQEYLQGLTLAAVMSLPLAIASGALFTRLAVQLRQIAADSASSSGLLLAGNTFGAAAGALLAAHFLLPAFGLADSWLMLTGGYWLLGWYLLGNGRNRLRHGLAILALGLIWFPDFSARWFDPVVQGFDDYRVTERREAADASLQLAVREHFGQTVAHRLLTDGFSMSGTEPDSQRYMRLFAQLPQSLHPGPERALLISYGLGTTAAALLADPQLHQLDIVDTSAATLSLSHGVVRPDPLKDSRSRIFIEDGRHFLLRSARNYDLITAEPPPPRLAGVESLYTQEYFALVRQRLAPGGMISHWLPVDQFSLASSKAVMRAFCSQFPDCSLWAGSHYNWILLGSRTQGDPGRTDFERLWRSQASRQLLQDTGFEQPGQLLGAFIADASQLESWLGPGPELRDDYPGRLSTALAGEADVQAYFRLMDDRETERRMVASGWVQQRIAAGWIAQAQQLWLWQPVLNGQVALPDEQKAPLIALALKQGLNAPVLKLLGLSRRELVAGVAAGSSMHRVVLALLQRDFSDVQRLADYLPPDTVLLLRQVVEQMSRVDVQS